MSRRKVSTPSPAAPKALLGGIRALIEASLQRVASTVNAELTLLFWQIGQRIHTEVLAGQQAGYGEEICRPWPSRLPATTGAVLGRKICAGWSSSPPRSPTSSIVATLSRQLS